MAKVSAVLTPVHGTALPVSNLEERLTGYILPILVSPVPVIALAAPVTGSRSPALCSPTPSRTSLSRNHPAPMWHHSGIPSSVTISSALLPDSTLQPTEGAIVGTTLIPEGRTVLIGVGERSQSPASKTQVGGHTTIQRWPGSGCLASRTMACAVAMLEPMGDPSGTRILLISVFHNCA